MTWTEKRRLDEVLDLQDPAVPRTRIELADLSRERGRPVRLARALDLLRSADKEPLDLRLWGSMAVEYLSQSFTQLGFHDEHWDIDLVARPVQRSRVLSFLKSHGFAQGKVVHRGLDGAGWIFLKNERGELVEVCFTHALDESMLSKSKVTVPLHLVALRGLAGAITPETISRADDLIAILLDYDPALMADEEKWREIPLPGIPGVDGPFDGVGGIYFLNDNASLVHYRLQALNLSSAVERTVLLRLSVLLNWILRAGLRPFFMQIKIAERWGFLPGAIVDRQYSVDEKWQPLADPVSEVWFSYMQGEGGDIKKVCCR